MIMIGLYAAAGLLIGTLLNWAVDYLPRFSTTRAITTRPPSPRWTFAAWQLLTSAAKRTVSPATRFSASIELGTALLCAYLGVRFGLTWDSLLLAAVCVFLILIAAIDLKYRLVLNALIYPAILITLVLQIASPGKNLPAVLMGAAFGFIIFAAVAWLRPGELGGGDIKLATWIGLFFGFPTVLWALIIGVTSGGITVAVLLLSRRWNLKSQIPYAPFLCLGALIALFYNPLTSIYHF